MKRLVVAMLVVLAVLPAVAGGVAHAAPEAITRETVGPYEGSFQGVAYGDNGSRAPLSLDLTHRGNVVEGRVSLGEGLYVDGGFCGQVHVPATTQYVEGQTVPPPRPARGVFCGAGIPVSTRRSAGCSGDGDVR
jgi:hypothetical protein